MQQHEQKQKYITNAVKQMQVHAKICIDQGYPKNILSYHR